MRISQQALDLPTPDICFGYLRRMVRIPPKAQPTTSPIAAEQTSPEPQTAETVQAAAEPAAPAPRVVGESASSSSQHAPQPGARAQIDLPASGNHGGSTRVVVQHLDDGIEDGHEVVFQRQEPQVQYRCFLESWLDAGTPRVPRSDATGCE